MSGKNSTSKPEVFVLVPSYNHASFVERCLKSIIKQTVQPTKLLVIDDGSRDESVEVIEKILAECPFSTELIARPNRGLSATLNQGFELSTGRYFAYLGSDDVWLPEFLERRTELLEANPKAIMAYGNAFLIDENDLILESSADWSGYKLNDTRKMLLFGIAPVSSTVFYRRTALEKVRWNEGSRLEDYELYLKLSTIGEFAFDSRIDAAWRQHSYNVSGDMPLMLAEVLAALERNRTALQLSSADLEQVQKAVCFRYAEDFVRRGLKRESFELALGNWRGASDLQAIFRVALRLALPMKVISWRRNQVRRQANNKYGFVQI